MKAVVSILAALLLPATVGAQVYSGSDGSDGALDFSSISYTTNILIDMHSHTNGVYQYSYVNIPANVTVTFITNANNSPVTWLVQSNVTINGSVNIVGQNPTGTPPPANPCLQIGGTSGPGGSPGGNSGQNGLGPGGGTAPSGGGGYGTAGTGHWGSGAGGSVYGNTDLIPLVGGSGGAGDNGSHYHSGGGGSGGAILIAAAGSIQLNGVIEAGGALGFYSGGGSGGAVKLLTSSFSGNGEVDCGANTDGGGQGRVRIGAFQNTFTGTVFGVSSAGFDNGTNLMITHQPVSQTNSPGSNVVFTVGVYGVAPLHFQWDFFGTPIAEATNQSLLLTNINPAMIGEYSVTISNSVKTLVSSNAVLTLLGSTTLFDGTIPAWWRAEYGLSLTDPTLVTNYPPGDKLTYLEKYLYGLNPLTTDTDGDGLSDYDEIFVYHTNPLLPSTAGDGIPDGWKVQYGVNPLIADANGEAGFDGVTYMQIYQYDLGHPANQLDPQHPFAVGAGLSNYEIINDGQHTNRFYYDHEDRLVGAEYSPGISIAYTYDGNGNIVRQTVLSRVKETNGLPVLWSFLNGLTNGTAADGPYGDADGDGWSNYQEWLAGSNPNDPNSRPNLLGNPGTNIASLALSFTPSNFVMGVGQLDGLGPEEIVVGADGNPGTNANFLLVLTQTSSGWATQRMGVASLGVTSIAVGQVTNRPNVGIYIGLRGTTNGSGCVMEFMRNAGIWQSNLVAQSTNSAAFVLGVSGPNVLMSLAPTNGADGALYSASFSTNWNLTLQDTNTSHRGLGTLIQPQSQTTSASALRLLDSGGIATGMLQNLGTLQSTTLFSNLISYWNLDGNSSDTIGSHNGTDANVAYLAGKVNQAAGFNGSSSAIVTTGNINISGSSARTVSFWAKLNSTASGAFVSWGANGSGTSFDIINFSGHWYVSSSANDIDTGVPPDTNIHHHCVTYDGTTLKYYLDGINIKSASFSPNTANAPVSMGYRSYHNDLYLNGWIDDVGIWSRSLSPAEVGQLYGVYLNPLLLSEPVATNRYLWRGLSLAAATPRTAYTNGVSVFYAFVDDNDGNGQIDAGDNFVLAECTVSGTNTSLLTLTRIPIASAYAAQSYGLASAGFLNSSNQVLFTAEPDGNIFAWTATNGTASLQRQLFSGNYAGKAWHALTKVKTLEPGEGVAGLMVDPTDQNTCNVIFWPPQAVLPTPQPSLIETAPSAAVLPSPNPLGSIAVLTIRLWDDEGNASTPFLQYQILGATNWQNAAISALDGMAYSPTNLVAALPGGVNHALAWSAMNDLGGNVVTNVLLRVRAQDFMLMGDWSVPTPFTVNMNQDANGNGIPDWWEWQHFGSLQPGNGDFDGDGVSNYAEYVADTDPTDPTSYLHISGVQPVPGGVRITWQGGTWATQYLQQSFGLDPANVWAEIFTNLPPTPTASSFTNTAGTNRTMFYRIRVIR